MLYGNWLAKIPSWCRRLLPRLLRLCICLLYLLYLLCLVPYTLRLAQDVQASAPATRNCCACALRLVPEAGALLLRNNPIEN